MNENTTDPRTGPGAQVVVPLREVPSPSSQNHCGRRMTTIRTPGVKTVEGKTKSTMTTTRVCDRCGEQTREVEIL